MHAIAPDDSRQGLLIDYGGVLTSSIFDAFAGWCQRRGLPPDTVRDQFREAGPGQELLVDFECGRLTDPEFEAAFAPLLGAEPEGLLGDLLADMRRDEAMHAAVRAVHDAGRRTGLVSNSWSRSGYDFDPAIFDALVISAQEGLRKPTPEMYERGAERLGLEPRDCVFVDDLGANLKPARALGMATVLHRGAAQTISELEPLLGLDLRVL